MLDAFLLFLILKFTFKPEYLRKFSFIFIQLIYKEHTLYITNYSNSIIYIFSIFILNNCFFGHVCWMATYSIFVVFFNFII